MILNEITIENFYSVENQVIQLDKYSGLILVEGDNRDAGGSNGEVSPLSSKLLFGRYLGRPLESLPKMLWLILRMVRTVG